MNYKGFAYIYDFLMRDVPYGSWLSFLQDSVKQYNVEGKRVLDLACGTGEFSISLAKAGYQVTGVDLSEDMLMVAQHKAANEGIILNLFQQDMSELEGLGTFDIITIFCDSLNYLPTPESVQNTFKRASEHLNENGLLLFDVHSTYKIKEIFGHQTYTVVEDEVSYIWNCFEGDYPNSVEHELTFFVLDEETDQYSRVDELHIQRTYHEKDYKDWLLSSGFEILNITADYSNSKPVETSERIFFTCKKK